MSKTPQVPLFVELAESKVRLKSILVEQDSEVRVAGERHKLGDMRIMITAHRLRKQWWQDLCAPGLDSIEEGKVDDA